MNKIDDANIKYSVSVVIPIYNASSTVLKSIYSVLSQTRPCDEIIIVDDGSIDNGAALIQSEFSSSDKIFVYKISNIGAAGARNFGISKARYEFIAFLDSDDAWSLDKLEKQFDELTRDPSIQLIGSLTNMQGFNLKGIPSIKKMSVIPLHTLLFKNYFQTSTVVIRRAILNELGAFPVGRRHAEEGDLFMRIAARYKCVLINEVMVDYAGGKRGFGAAGLSANLWRMELGELSNIRGVFKRGECSFLLMTTALMFSLMKFFRRVIISLSRRLLHGK